MSDLGLIHVYTGPGKGKTTAALGLALRAWGRGLRVCIIQFMKSGEDYGEVVAIRRLKGIDLFQFGSGEFVEMGKQSPEDLRLAGLGLEKSREAITSGRYDLVIMDEANVAAFFGLLGVDKVVEVIRSHGNVEIVLTGRNAPEPFLREADLVTEMKVVKHPYDSGLDARPGVEY